jgi:hypothetical protein
LNKKRDHDTNAERDFGRVRLIVKQGFIAPEAAGHWTQAGRPE